MNGYQIGMKRLKVQLKKLRIDSNNTLNNSNENPSQKTTNNYNGNVSTTSMKCSY